MYSCFQGILPDSLESRRFLFRCIGAILASHVFLCSGVSAHAGEPCRFVFRSIGPSPSMSSLSRVRDILWCFGVLAAGTACGAIGYSAAGLRLRMYVLHGPLDAWGPVLI